ncbi:uncharacterized protein LOC133534190 isoform X1 [Cydia pomonella]|uniref:uncharacterized protein LOC133534190 isoform X1 n=1 Tax=Cydia pomonella TaxID=82600 RepID=UPI002ADD6346|nr:uncharacterized protein LOC133534190 isoform X1 [Cydia pomonella]
MNEIIEKLEKMFEDVTDITDPASMGRVLEILDQSRIEDEKYMQLLVDTLRGKEITWKLPEYQQNFRLSRKPPPEEAELCANGHFTKAEGELVKKNWESFVQKFRLPDTPMSLARWRNRTQIKISSKSEEEYVRNYVAAYLAQGLHRSLHQVFRYFQITYSYPVKLRNYTPTEEKIMEICFYHRPKDACVIASEVLGRDRRGIIKRFSQYTKGKKEPKQKIRWTLDLAAKLIHCLMEHSRCRFKKLKYNQFNPEVWRKVEEEMGQVSTYLREFWFSKLHVQLFAKCNIKLTSLRKIIFKKLKESSYEVWSDIRWTDLVKEFPDGFTDLFLYNVAKRPLRGVANYREKPLPQLVEQIDKVYIKRQNVQKRLKSLKYHKSDGSLSYIKHDVLMKDLMKDMSINQ